MFLLILRLLAVYFGTVAVTVLLAHRFITGIRPRIAILLALAPFLLVGKALLTAGVYAPIDIPYQAPPLSDLAPSMGTAVTQNPILGDVVYQEIPWRKAVREAVKNRRFPLWNPFILAGEPLMAVQQPVVFHPATWIGFLLPLAQQWTLEMALRIFLAALCAYLFLRDIGASEIAALFGALIWALSDYLVFFLGYPLTPAAAVFPLLLLGLRRLACSPGRGAVATTVVALLLIGTAGHPETLLHAVGAGGIYFLFELAPLTNRNRVRSVALSLLAGVLTLGLLAVLLLPLLEALPQTAEHLVRSTYYVHETRSVRLPQAISRIALNVVPYSYGVPGKGETGPGGWETAGYVGTIAWPLVLMGLVAKNRTKWPLIFLGVVGILLACRFPGIADLVGSLPLFKIAINERLIFLAAFASAALAALGLDWLLERKETGRLALLSGGGLALLIGVFAAFRPHMAALELPASYMWTRFILQALPLGLVIAVVLTFRRRVSLVLTAVVALFVVQRGLEEYEVYPTYPNRAFYPPLRSLDKIPRGVPDRMTAVGFSLIPNISALYEIEDVRGYEAMTFLPLFATYSLWCVPQGVWFNRVDDPTKPFLSFLNVRYVYAAPGFSPPLGWKVLYQGEEGLLFENPKALARAFVPRRLRYEADPERRLGVLWSISDFADLGVIGQAPPPGIEAAFPQQNGDASVRISSYVPGRITFDVVAASPAVVATSVTAWRGWKLTVDDAPAGLLPYNHAFLAFRVPPGRHTAVLRYLPDSFLAGSTTSLLTLGVALFLLLRSGRPVRPLA